ncbi:HD domain-containing protein [Brumimicrobium mesophilum]|uniref:HD domain-containing protein n=1 Tax=Brumimicrobium mesophilum TaxID=392717 RepID=UPI000D13F452|nr:HD domain-containing protein [Brumimicrobium mesophilum]
MKEVIQVVEEKVKKKFENEGTGHDWFHIDRVRRIALAIQKKDGGDRDVIELAALLHDISDHKFNGGDFNEGARATNQIIESLNVNSKIRNEVALIVKNVSYKGSGEEDLMPSLEGRIVQDADRIDAIGAIGIARTFAYGGSIGQPIYDPSVPPKLNQTTESYINERTHTINHFYEKLLLLEDRMHTDAGKKIAAERSQFMKDFLDQFYREWGE